MVQEYTIIGNSSSLYRWSKIEQNLCVKSISHLELDSLDKIKNPIVFGLAKTLAENKAFFDRIISKVEGRFTYISSSSVKDEGNMAYKYPRLKKSCENYLMENAVDLRIIRVGVPRDDSLARKYHGLVPVTTRQILIDSITKNTDDLIVEAFTLRQVEGTDAARRLSKLYGFTNKVLGNYKFLTRPLDFFVRGVSDYRGYGYSYFSLIQEMYVERLVVGNGLTALGVKLGLNDKHEDYSVLTTKKALPAVSIDNRVIEARHKGGNSSSWHGVISNFLNHNEVERLNFAKRFYRNLVHLNESFIPLAPIRPYSLLNNQKMIFGEVIRVARIDNLYKVYTTRGEIQCKKLYLCIGAMSLIKLWQSHTLSPNSICGDHRLGYIGSLILPSSIKLKCESNIHGHYKREISVNDRFGGAFEIYLRPAHGSWKDITKAEKYRTVYSGDTFNVLLRITSKMNLKLILEGIYNKFGWQLFKTNTYSIVVSRLEREAWSISREGFHESIEEFTKLNQNSAHLIENALAKEYPDAKIELRSQYKEFSGIHYLSWSVAKKELIETLGGDENLRVFSPLFYNIQKASHHSFDIMFDSYLNVINE